MQQNCFSVFHYIKNAPTEADAQKTQTPIVAKPTVIAKHITIIRWNLRFYQIR